ncbi:MAG TPA: phosphatase PAP2 family protein [Actinomycetes bacterium]
MSSPLSPAPTPTLTLAVLGVAAIVAAGAWLARTPGRTGAIEDRRWPWSRIAGLRRRLDDGGRPWLVLLSVLVLALGMAALLLVTWGIGALTKTGPVMRLDRPVYDWFVGHRAAWLTAPVEAFTGIGSYTAAGVISAVCGALLALRRRTVLPLVLLLTVPLEKYLQLWAGTLIHAPRPPAASSIGPVGGFPSGGSARVVLVCGMAAWLLAEQRSSRRSVVAAWTATALLAFAEGWSRMYLGRHWVVDVLGGWLFGALIMVVLLAAAALLPLPARRRLRRRQLAGDRA